MGGLSYFQEEVVRGRKEEVEENLGGMLKEEEELEGEANVGQDFVGLVCVQQTRLQNKVGFSDKNYAESFSHLLHHLMGHLPQQCQLGETECIISQCNV